MTKDLIERIIIQLEPSLAQQFIKEALMDNMELIAFKILKEKLLENNICLTELDGNFKLIINEIAEFISKEEYEILSVGLGTDGERVL